MSNTVRYGLIGLLLIAAWLIIANMLRPAPAEASPQATNTTTNQSSTRQSEAPAGQHSIVEAPQLSAQQINTILVAYRSPMSGEGQRIYDLGRSYGISSDYALAIWLHESLLGGSNLARQTRNPGNIRCLADLACYQGFAQMGSWAEGIERWYRLIHDGYVEGEVTKGIVGHPCTTIEQIIEVYAPKADSNDPDGYIQVVIKTVAAWRAGKVVV